MISDETQRDEVGRDGVGRRAFLGMAAAGVVGAGVGGVAEGQEKVTAATRATTRAAGPLVDSPPVLQNPSATGVTVVWAVGRPATGWVEYGGTPELGKRADLAVYGLNPFDSRFLAARVEGLEAGRPVFYRVVTVPVEFKSAYKIERGEPVAGKVYRYQPPDAGAAGATFAVINDTHERAETLAALTGRLAAEPADLTVWNGDVFNDIRSDDQIVQQVLRPAGMSAAYGAERAVLFTSGNHDVRGVHARGLARAISPWRNEDPLGRCFTVRHGPLAIVGLDTGEDKPDRHPAWSGLANFEPYRAAQAQWLKGALARPEVASAPFVVVFCHIPLWGRPGDNPGDTLEGYAGYCRNAQQLWHPALAAARVQVVISGHTHRHRYDPPEGERGYGQLVGGGPAMQQATLIRGRVSGGKMEIEATDLAGTSLGKWEYGPRAG